MRVLARLTIAIATLLVTSTSAAGPRPHYSADPTRILWFMTVADTHIGSNGDRAVENLMWLLNDAFHIVQPQLMITCGDLTDANSLWGIPWTQQEDEWKDYRGIIDDSTRTLSEYMDIPGNHDQYGDKTLSYYRRWSPWGSAFDRTQHSVRLETNFGVYHFLGVATPGNDGAYPPADRAGLDAGELAYIQAAFDANPDANMHLVFGHHPTGNLNYGGKEFLGAMSTYQASSYLYGHTHTYKSEYRDGTLHVNLDTLGKGDKDNVAIGVIDHDLLSVRIFSAGIWPFVVISTPADAGLGGGNPHAYSVPPNWTEAPVRAVVFAPRAPDKVEFQVANGTWIEMREVSPSVWQGSMDTTGMEAGRYNLKVRAHPWTSTTDTISFRIGATACSNGLDDDFDGLTDWPDDPGCESPGTNDENWVKPGPDPDPDTTEPVPDQAFGEEADPDAFSEEVGPLDDGTPIEDIPVDQDNAVLVDVPAADVPAVNDPGAPDAWTPGDPGPRTDQESPDVVSPGVDASGGDIPTFEPVRGSGGCTAGGRETGGPAWLLVALAGLAWVLRRRTPGCSR